MAHKTASCQKGVASGGYFSYLVIELHKCSRERTTAMMTITHFEAVQMFTDFLATHPSDEEILNFHFPEEIEKRVQELVSKNNAGTITSEEFLELQEYERLDTYGSLLKTKVMQRRKQAQVPA